MQRKADSSGTPLMTPLRSLRFGGLTAALVALGGCGFWDFAWLEQDDRLTAAEIPASSAQVSEAQVSQAASADAVAPGPLALIDTRLQPAPEEFDARATAVWDGYRTLQGIWVAHPEAETARRVRILNVATGQAVDGALFRRDGTAGDAEVLISSDAAGALGMVPGKGAELSIVAIRRGPPTGAGADLSGEAESAGRAVEEAETNAVPRRSATAGGPSDVPVPNDDQPTALAMVSTTATTGVPTAALAEELSPEPTEAPLVESGDTSAVIEERAAEIDPIGEPVDADQANADEPSAERRDAQPAPVGAASSTVTDIAPEPQEARLAVSDEADPAEAVAPPTVRDEPADVAEIETATAESEAPDEMRLAAIGPAESALPVNVLQGKHMPSPHRPPVEDWPIFEGEVSGAVSSVATTRAPAPDRAPAAAPRPASAATSEEPVEQVAAVSLETDTHVDQPATDATGEETGPGPELPTSDVAAPVAEPEPSEVAEPAAQTAELAPPTDEVATESGQRDEAGPAPKLAYIQSGVFGVEANAARLIDRLNAAGFPTEGRALRQGSSLTRVVSGPFATRSALADALRTIRRIGPSDALPVKR